MQAIPPGPAAPLYGSGGGAGKCTGPFWQSIGNDVTQSYGTKVFRLCLDAKSAGPQWQTIGNGGTQSNLGAKSPFPSK